MISVFIYHYATTISKVDAVHEYVTHRTLEIVDVALRVPQYSQRLVLAAKGAAQFLQFAIMKIPPSFALNGRYQLSTHRKYCQTSVLLEITDCRSD